MVERGSVTNTMALEQNMANSQLSIERVPNVGRSMDILVLGEMGGVQGVQLSLEVEVAQDLQEKSLVCALYATDGAEELVDLSSSSWPRSSRLAAPYQYLPRIEHSVRLNLRPFESEVGIFNLFVVLFPWIKSVSREDAKFGRCFAGLPMTLGNRKFIAFHQLRRAEHAND